MTSNLPSLLFNQGLEQHRTGQWDDAVRSYQRVLDLQPQASQARYLLASVEMERGNFQTAIDHLGRILEDNPDAPDVLNRLGTAYHRLQNWPAAIDCFKRALRAEPTNQQAWFNLGGLLATHGELEQAENCLIQGLQFDPNNSPMLQQLAACQSGQGKWKSAEHSLRSALSITPDHSDLAVTLGVCLVQQERLPEAAEVFAQIVEREPDYAEIHSNLSYVYERMGQPDVAIEYAERAIALRPEYAPSYNNLGMACRTARLWAKAIESFTRALEIDPQFALARFNRGTTELLLGHLPEGWSDYEFRNQLPESRTPQFSTPAWCGDRLPGGRVLVFVDQGLGDTIQFARFLPELKSRSQAHIVFHVPQTIVPILQGVNGVDEVVGMDQPVPAHDVHVAISSLGTLLNVDLPGLTVEGPYLPTGHALTAELQALIEASPAENLRVGLVWQGNPQQTRDALRSVALGELLPLSQISGLSWYSIQVDHAGRSQLPSVADNWPIHDAGAHLKSFADTAALFESLDLLITVDTASAHLAGALGRPVWTLLWQTADWRWFLDRDDSPWYGTMRLYRQQRWGEWKPVIQRVMHDLQALVSTAPK